MELEIMRLCLLHHDYQCFSVLIRWRFTSEFTNFGVRGMKESALNFGRASFLP